MKKFLLIILCLISVFSLTSCQLWNDTSAFLKDNNPIKKYAGISTPTTPTGSETPINSTTATTQYVPRGYATKETNKFPAEFGPNGDMFKFVIDFIFNQEVTILADFDRQKNRALYLTYPALKEEERNQIVFSNGSVVPDKTEFYDYLLSGRERGKKIDTLGTLINGARVDKFPNEINFAEARTQIKKWLGITYPSNVAFFCRQYEELEVNENSAEKIIHVFIVFISTETISTEKAIQ